MGIKSVSFNFFAESIFTSWMPTDSKSQKECRWKTEYIMLRFTKRRKFEIRQSLLTPTTIFHFHSGNDPI